MNHELDQLAAMFYQLGKAAAQVVGDRSNMVDENKHCHNIVETSPLGELGGSRCRIVRGIETI